MVLPNIGAFIAWGLITALFIPTGWIPSVTLAKLVGPMITYLLPVLIGYTGGRIVHGQRGAVIGAIATMGVVVGSSVPMFLGAMIMGPAAAWILQQFDKLTAERIKAGFEMLVDNFSIGIIGGAMALLGVWGVGPIVNKLTDWAGSGVNYLVTHHLLPFSSVLIEPAKVLLSAPMTLPAHDTTTITAAPSASAGVALPEPETAWADLLRHADIALYHAKTLPGRAVLYTPEMRRPPPRTTDRGPRLREANASRQPSQAEA
jgi:hypothetical protein